MAETGNYQLNQWESTDRIMREDFNADNAKVDQALGILAEQAAQVMPVTINFLVFTILTSCYFNFLTSSTVSSTTEVLPCFISSTTQECIWSCKMM